MRHVALFVRFTQAALVVQEKAAIRTQVRVMLVIKKKEKKEKTEEDTRIKKD